MDRYAVIGNPVEHSKSPLIHTRFAAQTGERLEYTAMLVEPGNFERDVTAFFAGQGRGANVTVPFKQEAWALVEVRSDAAQTAGAVNTLHLDDAGRLCGHNTDGVGLVTDIVRNHGGSLRDKSILVLGAGGATRGILAPFLDEAPARVCIANRTVSRAEDLARLFAGRGPVEACGFDALAGRQFDWIVNATAASLQGDVPPVPPAAVTDTTWCYDLMYGDEPTPFCRWATDNGAARVMDGLGMLVEQAAESFLVWRGVRPETGAVIAELRS